MGRSLARLVDFVAAEPVRLSAFLRLPLIGLIVLLVSVWEVEHWLPLAYAVILGAYSVAALVWVVVVLRGPHVSPGYTDPARDAGMFEQGWLVSGDLGHLDAQGYLHVTGRAKDVIIRGGHNIYPARIEALAMRHGAIDKVAAFPVTKTLDEFDIAAQGVTSHHYWMTGGELETFSAPFRYVWPSELDLMARLAGMTLRERWSDWNRDPFTSDSRNHVSVWQKPS